MAKMLASETMREQFLSSQSFSLCGIAHSFHNAVDHCVVVIFAANVKEDIKALLKMMREPSLEKVE